MTSKKVTAMLGVVAIFGFLFATGAFGASKIVIGNPECLSGKFSKAGEQAVGGIKACVKWVNEVYGGVKVGGKKIPLEYKLYDCESKKEVVTSLIERLITVDKVDFLFAPYSSPLTLAGAPVAEKYKKLFMDHGGASDRIFEQGFKYVVQTIGPGTSYHLGTLNMIRKIDPKANKLAMVYKDAEFSRDVMKGAEKHAQKTGFNIVFKRTYPEGAADLTPILSDMKGTNPDIVIGGGHEPDGMLLARQMADLDINAKAISILVSVTLPSFYDGLKSIADGIMGPSHWEYGVTYSEQAAKKLGLPWIGPSQDEFVKRFKEAVGKDLTPEYHSAEAGAAVLALVMAVEMADSLDNAKVREALGKLHFMSFYGGWDVDDTGLQVGHSMVDMQWQGDNRVIVWPEEAATGKPCYPVPTFSEKAKGATCKPK
jgi:branched-chain amino acid transport system substrate-binding protein